MTGDEHAAEADRLFRDGDIRGAYDRARAVLRADRGNAPAHLVLARIAIEQGSFANAVQLCRAAIAINPQDPAYRAQLAYALVLSDDIVGARREVMAAANLPNMTAETFDLMGAVYHAVGDFAEGAAMLERAVTLQPGSPALLTNLGALKTICGDIDGARNAFRAAIVADPSMGRAYAALSEIRTATATDNHVAAIEALIRSTRDPFAGIVLHHALAREFDGLGDYRRAFAVLGAGKQALAREVKPDSALDRAMFADLLHLIDRRDDRPGYTGFAPIFVVGMPRSGTTVVERILSNCDGVRSIGESREFSRITAAATGTASPRMVDAPMLRSRQAAIDPAAIGSAYADRVGRLVQSSDRILDKMPLNLLLADLIIRALPDARIVCVKRDAMDTVVGNYRQMFEFNSRTYDYSLSLEHTASFVADSERLITRLAQAHPKNVHIVRLENLITNTGPTARRLLAFCDLPWTDDCVAIEHNLAPAGSASAVQVRSRIHDGYVGRWRRYEHALGPAATILNAWLADI